MIRNRTGSIALLCLVFTMILAACGGAPAATPTTAPAAVTRTLSIAFPCGRLRVRYWVPAAVAST